MLGLSELVPLAFTGIRRLGWAQLELGAGRGGRLRWVRLSQGPLPGDPGCSTLNSAWLGPSP